MCHVFVCQLSKKKFSQQIFLGLYHNISDVANCQIKRYSTKVKHRVSRDCRVSAKCISSVLDVGQN